MDAPPLTRRQVLAGLAGAAAAAGLAACTGSAPPPAPTRASATGAVRAYELRAAPARIDLAGRAVDTWAYGGAVPGPPIRAAVGDRVAVAFRNDLPEATSVHWHGLAVPNAMDGVPHLTSDPVGPGGSFAFEFVVPDPGTYWFHPHTGLQSDRGLYAPFIVDDPADPGGYDAEWTVLLDDWTDGVGATPQDILAGLRGGGAGMMGMRHGGGMDGGDVEYPLYLVNGRPPEDPEVMRAEPGQRVRLRIINAAADTIFDVALSGHDLTLTHSDGFPVHPRTAPAVRVGMGERYDSTVLLGDGAFALVARPVGKQGGPARALLRTGGGDPPPAGWTPKDPPGGPLTADRLRAAPGAPLPPRDPDTVLEVALGGGMGSYVWTINGRTYDDAEPLTVAAGQAGRLRFANRTMMPHPMHLHGHTFQLGPAGGGGPRKDTLLIPPMGAAEADFAAENPGAWMLHCHNAYHAEAGMMTRLDYTL